MPQVDVIVPVYNTAVGYVREALRSALGQSLRDLRVFVVNDGSNESCTADLEALVAELADPRLNYLASTNRGPSGARNLGIAAGSAPLVALLDADDVWYPHKMERQLAHFASRPDADLVWALTDTVRGADMGTLAHPTTVDDSVNALTQEQACVAMLRRNFVSITTVVFRRASAARVGFFDEGARTIEDKDLWFRMLVDGQKLVFFPEVLGIYRIHAASASRNPDKMRDGRLRLIATVDALQGRGIGWVDREWPALRRDMLHHAYHEVVETYLESGRYLKALQHAMPWYSGLSGRSVKLGAKSVLGAIGLRRVQGHA